MLKKQKTLVRTYNSSDFANLLAAGDVDLAHGYNGQIAEVVAASPDRLAYVIPKEGGTLWMDNAWHPGQGASNVDAPTSSCDYVLEPRGRGADRQRRPLRRRQPGGASRIDAQIRNDPSIYPPEEVLDRCELIEDLGETTQFLDELWTEVKAE